MWGSIWNNFGNFLGSVHRPMLKVKRYVSETESISILKVTISLTTTTTVSSIYLIFSLRTGTDSVPGTYCFISNTERWTESVKKWTG
jgi:hypothetical protein